MPRILVVDDDESLLAMVEHSLKFDHYSVDTVTDGDEALEFLRTNSYDLAIVDLNLPGLSGTEICSAYRTSGGKVPILMLTGQTAIADKGVWLGIRRRRLFDQTVFDARIACARQSIIAQSRTSVRLK